MDVLSEVLKVVKLRGALFYNGEFSAPWCERVFPASSGQTLRTAGGARNHLPFAYGGAGFLPAGKWRADFPPRRRHCHGSAWRPPHDWEWNRG